MKDDKNMKESVLIRNFGPVREIEIEDIKPFTVFIGESGIGKSTVLKTVALFRWIFKKASLRAYMKLSGIPVSPFKFDFRSYLRNGGLEEYLKKDTEIRYRIGNCEISYVQVNGLSVSPISDIENISLEKCSFISDKRCVLPEFLLYGAAPSASNYYLRELFDVYQKATSVVKDLRMPFLGVNFHVNEKGPSRRRYMISGGEDDDCYDIRLQDASSGIQTATPLTVIIEYFSKHYNLVNAFNQSVVALLGELDNLSLFQTSHNVGDIQSRRVNLHVEEPELSLFPEGQCGLLDFIADRFIIPEREYEMTFMMATHSPYIVNYLNLLVTRHDKKVENKPSIPFEKVGVYQIIDGYLSDLSVTESKIFDTMTLSEPIDDIYSEYNELNHG